MFVTEKIFSQEESIKKLQKNNKTNINQYIKPKKL
jgi:hypothetical protein